VMDPRHTIVALNPAAEAQLGFEQQRAVGRSLDSVLSGVRDRLRIRLCPVVAQGREAGHVALLTASVSRERAEGTALR